jgi:WD40 repeat protein
MDPGGGVMRLLPRSARGTWLLATAVWAGGCAVLWTLMPVVPRAHANIPSSSALGVEPGGRSVTLLDVPENDDGRSSLRVWNTTTGAIRTFDTGKGRVPSCAKSADGRWLAIPTDSKRVRIFDLTTGNESETAGVGLDRWNYDLFDFSPDGRWLAAGEPDEGNGVGVRLWDLRAKRPHILLGTARQQVAFSADGSMVAAETDSGEEPDDENRIFLVWDAASGRELNRLRKLRWFRVAGFTRDSKAIIAARCTSPSSLDNTPMQYVCWNLADGHERWSVDDIEVCTSVDGGRQLAFWRRDGAIGLNEAVVLNADDGQFVRRMPLRENEWLAAFGPDGKTLVVCSPYPTGLGAIWAWLFDHGLPVSLPAWSMHRELRDAATGRLMYAMPDGSCAYAPDGRFLAVTFLSRPGYVELWDIPPRKPVGWFALAAGVLALPLAGLAWRRSRRLRRQATLCLKN